MRLYIAKETANILLASL